MVKLEIIKEFSEYKYPGPRYRALGGQSGEQFREECFIPWLEKHIDEDIILDINGFVAYPPSFFSEFILGTAKENKKYARILKKAKVKCEIEEFRKRIEQILKEIR